MRYSEDEAGMQSSSIFDGTVFGSQMMVHLERSMRRWSLWQKPEMTILRIGSEGCRSPSKSAALSKACM